MTETADTTFHHTIAQPRAAHDAGAENAAPQQKPLELTAILMGLWGMFVLIISLLSVWGHLQIGLNNDHLVLMDEVRKLMDGGIPYVDYTDVSPPLIHLIYILPYMATQKTGIPLYVTLYLLTYAAIALSLIACAAILVHSGASKTVRWITVGGIALGLLGSSFVHQVFADRDHLMLVLAAPWFVLQSPLAKRNVVPAVWRLTAATMAAVGFAFKPFFYVFYVMSSAFALLDRPWRNILHEREHHIIWGFAACYVIVVFVYFPQYPFTILPVGLQTYGAISWTWDSKLGVIRNELLGRFGAVALAGTGLLLATAPRLFDRNIAYLYALLLACILSYAINFGWYYTQYPFIGVAPLLTITVTAKLIVACRRIRRRPWRPIGMLITAAGFAWGGYSIYMTPIIDRAERDIDLQREEGHTYATYGQNPLMQQKLDAHFAPHPRFMFFTMDLWSVNLLKEGTSRENVSRFDILWPLPGILKLQGDPARKEEYTSLMSWFLESIASDIERHRPDMLINDISPTKRNLPKDYDVMSLLKSDPKLAKLLGEYELVDTLNYCDTGSQTVCSYEVYYRK